MNKGITRSNEDVFEKQKILLLMLPYWTPLVPPQGIAHLKSFLQHHGYKVRTADGNTEELFKELYDGYFDLLRKYIPVNKQGNFYNLGHDVIRNHMMAHIHYRDRERYIKLVKKIVYETYFVNLADAQVDEFEEILTLFFLRMENYILGLIEKEKPAVLGISVLRDTIGPSLFAFRLAKERFPGIQTVMGGSIFSDQLRIDSPNFRNFLKKAPYIDKIVVGEGQYLFLKILRGELPANQRVFTLEDIDKKTLGYSQLNVPDMTDFDVKSEYPYLSAQGSSSCPMKCSFCNVSVFYGEYKEKPAQQLIREMTNLYEKYGVQLFFMNDSLLNFTASAIAEEFKKSPISLYWDGYMRVGPEPSDRENTILWRKGGLYRVRLGVESGSQFVLDAMQKKITPQQTKDTLFALAGAGIKTTTYWVIGHPGETEEDFLKTLDLLEETKNDIYEAECNPFFMGFNGQPNTEVWKDTRVQIYPEEDLDMLIIQTWKSDCYPSKAEAYERVNRFVQRCDELGIPNPYSVEDIYQADERWKQLHPNAVPPLVGFLNAETYVEECKDVVNLVYARKKK